MKGFIVGLGNPGPEYENTRHNAGFWTVDRVVELGRERKSLGLASADSPHDCELWTCTPGGRAGGRFLLGKPLTYMNRSGVPVARLVRAAFLDPAHVLAVHDDLDLPPGRVKLKRGGGAGGHRGVLSLEQELGSAGFMRLRIGVGRPEESWQARDWVLEEFEPGEAALVREAIEAGIRAVFTLFRMGVGPGWSRAVEAVNGFRPATWDEEDGPCRDEKPRVEGAGE